ncbi:MAG: hypothetical protein ACREDW_06190, partial [Aestuariivirgaceae bacterium]
MRKVFFIVFMLGLALGLTTFLNGASAAECGRKRPCDQGRPMLVQGEGSFDRFVPPGLAKQRR